MGEGDCYDIQGPLGDNRKGGSSRRQPALWARVDGSAVLVLETQCLSLRHRSSDCGDGLE